MCLEEFCDAWVPSAIRRIPWVCAWVCAWLCADKYPGTPSPWRHHRGKLGRQISSSLAMNLVAWAWNTASSTTVQGWKRGSCHRSCIWTVGSQLESVGHYGCAGSAPGVLQQLIRPPVTRGVRCSSVIVGRTRT